MRDGEDGYALHRRLGYKVSRLSRLMQSRLERGLAPLGLTRLMWCVLTGVADEGVETPSGLADYLGVTRPATSRLLREMEGRGLIRRAGLEEDLRARRVELTEAGRATLEAARAPVAEARAHFGAKLPPDEMTLVMRALDRLAAGEDTLLTRL